MRPVKEGSQCLKQWCVCQWRIKQRRGGLSLCIPHCKVQNSSSVTVSQINILPFKLERLLFPIDLPFCQQTSHHLYPPPKLRQSRIKRNSKSFGILFSINPLVNNFALVFVNFHYFAYSPFYHFRCIRFS